MQCALVKYNRVFIKMLLTVEIEGKIQFIQVLQVIWLCVYETILQLNTTVNKQASVGWNR